MKFAIPRIWREPTDHLSNCFFCMVDPSNRKAGKHDQPIQYPNIPSSIAPVPHSHELPIPSPPKKESSSSHSRSSTSDDLSDVFQVECEEKRRPYYPKQDDLNDLIRDLGLTKSGGELLISGMKEWNLLDSSVRVTDQRMRHETFSVFFTVTNDLCYCHDIVGLFSAIGIPYNPSQWRLFIDSSNRSLKAVLLSLPSLPLAHSVHMKE
jgi:hypothetical protein